jgi:hypothetical protein
MYNSLPSRVFIPVVYSSAKRDKGKISALLQSARPKPSWKKEASADSNFRHAPDRSRFKGGPVSCFSRSSVRRGESRNAVNEGGFVLDFLSPLGTSLVETDRTVNQIEAILNANPAMQTYSKRTGGGLGGSLPDPTETADSILLPAVSS